MNYRIVLSLAVLSRLNGAQLPHYFEQNKGQAESSVRFLSRSDSYTEFFKDHEVVWTFGDARKNSLHMEFAGARFGSLTGLDQSRGKVNYVLGQDEQSWVTGIDCYARVRYQNIYPGIHAEFHRSDELLEYDFAVSPHARPSDIKLLFSGAKSVRLLRSGDLMIDGMLHRAPLAYQMVDGTRHPVEAHFKLRRRGATTEVAFALARYDHGADLTIDPVISYEKQIAGEISSIAVDSQGALYITGFTRPADPLVNSPQVLVAKLTPDGSDFVYLTYVGGGGPSFPAAIAVDSTGNAWVGGVTNAPDFPNTVQLSKRKLSPGVCSSSSTNSCSDGFVIGVNAAGTMIYDALIGGSGNDSVNGIGAEASGTIWIAGSTASSDFPVAGSLLQSTLNGSRDGFVARLTPASGLIMSTYLGGSGIDYVDKLALDSSGNAYVAGETNSTDFPVAGSPFQSAYGGGTDIFLAKFLGSDSSISYATYYGGPNGELVGDLKSDSAGNAYISLLVLAQPLDLTSGVVIVDNPQNVLLKIDPFGSSLLYDNPTNFIFGANIAVDTEERVTEAGFLYFGPLSANAISTCNGSGGIVQLEADGVTVRYASDILGVGGSLVALDSSGSVYIAGGNAVEKQDFSQDPGMAATCTVDAFNADFSPSLLAPGELVVIYGRNLGPSTGVAASFDSSGELPTQLSGVQVTFDGRPAPLLYVNANQINTIVPFETSGQTTTALQVSYDGSSAPSVMTPMGPASNIAFQESNQVIALNQDGTYNSASNPATAGSVMTIFSSGGGQTNPPLIDGQIATVAAPLVLPTQVLLISTAPSPESSPPQPVPAQVLYAGSAPGEVAGVIQVNFVIPAGLSAPPIESSYGNVLVALVIGPEDGYGTSGGIFVQP
jgi:uncharacterized protein (TIGR03437 family)